jgi:hypothetical protein
LIAIEKPLCGLKMVFQNPYKARKDFDSGFTELHTELDADTMHSCKNNTCPQHNVTWQTEATGFRSVT